MYEVYEIWQGLSRHPVHPVVLLDVASEVAQPIVVHGIRPAPRARDDVINGSAHGVRVSKGEVNLGLAQVAVSAISLNQQRDKARKPGSFAALAASSSGRILAASRWVPLVQVDQRTARYAVFEVIPRASVMRSRALPPAVPTKPGPRDSWPATNHAWTALGDHPALILIEWRASARDPAMVHYAPAKLSTWTNTTGHLALRLDMDALSR